MQHGNRWIIKRMVGALPDGLRNYFYSLPAAERQRVIARNLQAAAAENAKDSKFTVLAAALNKHKAQSRKAATLHQNHAEQSEPANRGE